eukprot:s3602_g9.t1
MPQSSKEDDNACLSATMLVAMMLFIHDLLQAGSSSLLDVLFLFILLFVCPFVALLPRAMIDHWISVLSGCCSCYRALKRHALAARIVGKRRHKHIKRCSLTARTCYHTCATLPLARLQINPSICCKVAKLATRNIFHAIGLLASRVGEASHPGPTEDPWADYLNRKNAPSVMPSAKGKGKGKSKETTKRCRWTDLEIDCTLFSDAISQIRPEDFSGDSSGVVLLTRDLFTAVSKVRSNKALVAVMPGSRNDELHQLGIQDSAVSVHWLFFKDPADGSLWQRKQVTLAQLGQVTCLPKSLDAEPAWSITPTCELTAVLSKKLFTSEAEWIQFIASSRSSVTAAIYGLHKDLTSDSVSFYPWTKVSDALQRVTFRIPLTLREQVLSASGTSLCFIVQENCRDSDARQKRSERTSVLWLKKTTYGQALVLIKQLPQHLGLVISATDFGIRVATADLSASRKIVYPTDARWDDANLQIRGANRFEITGLPIGCNRKDLVQHFSKWKDAAGNGWAIIPLSMKVVGNQSIWLVSADSDPPSHCYSMQNNRVLDYMDESDFEAAIQLACRKSLETMQVHADSIKSARQQLAAQLPSGLTLRAAAADGNCLFHALCME